MSFVLGKPIDSLLVKQVEARQKILGNSDRVVEGDYSFFLQKMPWIKLTSAINVGSSDELARLNILTNGINLAGSSEVAGYQDTSLGIRPKPGITSMNLNTHNRYGSLRTATVQFIIHSVEQLNIYEQLFMRPGYSALLEWGHSKYLDAKTSAYKVKDIPTLIDFFKGEGSPKTKTELYGKIDALRKEYNYNYDGMYGLIKNFSWSIQQDGTYACSVDIVSIGSTLESLNINVAVTNSEIQAYSKFAAEIERSNIIAKLREEQEIENEGGTVTEVINPDKPTTESDLQLAKLVEEYLTELAGFKQYLLDNKLASQTRGIKLYGYKAAYDQISGVTEASPGNFTKTGNVWYSDEKSFRLIGVKNSPAPTIRIITPPIYYNVKNNELIIVDHTGALSQAKQDDGKGGIQPISLRGGTAVSNKLRLASETYYRLPIESAMLFAETSGGNFQLKLQANQIETLRRMKLGDVEYQAAVHEYVYTLTPIDFEFTADVGASASETQEKPEDKVPEQEPVDIFEIIATDKEPLQSRIHYILHQAKYKISQDRPASEVKRNGVHTLQDADMKYYKVPSEYRTLRSKSVTIKTGEGTDSTELIYYSYIQLGFLLDTLNTLLPRDGAKGEELFKFHTKKSVTHFIKTLKAFHYSVDTSKCLLPPEQGAVDILSIFVEIDYIGDVVESFYSSGQVRLYDLIDTILKDIVIAIGNFNSFELQYFELDNTFHVVDREILDPDAFKNEYATFSIFGKNSFVRNLNLTSKLSPAIGAQLAIAAQANPESNGIEGTAWKYFNKNLKDRFIEQKVDDVTRRQIVAAEAATAKADKEAKLKDYADVFDYLRATYPEGGTASYYYRRAVESVIPQYATFCQRQLVEQIQGGQDFGFIIPYELSITVDGISGFNVMESFKILDSIIPDSYKANSKNGIGFIVTGIQQAVSTGGWTTTVKAQIYNTNDKGRAGAPIIKDAEQSLSPPPVGDVDPRKNLDKGWEGKEQEFKQTTITYAQAVTAVKAATTNVNLRKAVLAVMIREQGGSNRTIKGFNYNFGGYDITSGGWSFTTFGENISNGFTYATEGGTGLKKAFVSFVSLEKFMAQKVKDFTDKGFDRATNAEECAKVWYEKWNGFGARAHWRNNYQGLKDKYPSQAEYDAYVLENFKPTYTLAAEQFA